MKQWLWSWPFATSSARRLYSRWPYHKSALFVHQLYIRRQRPEDCSLKLQGVHALIANLEIITRVLEIPAESRTKFRKAIKTLLSKNELANSTQEGKLKGGRGVDDWYEQHDTVPEKVDTDAKLEIQNAFGEIELAGSENRDQRTGQLLFEESEEHATKEPKSFQNLEVVGDVH
uniref:Uncharacterized protein n=1 Tax=Ditylenchus dipsaci TaxID=166011 RepID=A0A915CVE1_9BILA